MFRGIKCVLKLQPTTSFKVAFAQQTSRLSRMSTSATATSEAPAMPKRISICHMRATNDKEHNRRQVKEIVQLAKEQSSTFVFLPECCDFVGRDRTETLSLSEPVTGPTVQYYQSLAKANNLWLSIGGFHELPNGTTADSIYNAHVIIDDCGQLVAKYQKLHLFDVDTPEFKFRESSAVTGGSTIVAPLRTPVGQLGLMICYDLRFPELSTILRKQGANVLTYPSAFAMSTGKAHWEVLLRSRAIETQCYVVASAQIGFHNEKRESYGHGQIVDPFGHIVAQCDNSKDLDVRTVDLDQGVVEKVRRNMPCFEHRRNDIYSLLPVELSPECAGNVDFMFQTYPIDRRTIFYQSQHSVAFVNIRCVVTGHVLVASRRPVHRLKELSAEEVANLFQTVCKVQRMTEHFYATSSATVTVQDGELAGQTVAHVHCHVMPRRKGDFAQNDDIYVELEKDRQYKDDVSVRRPLDDMIAEADAYRRTFDAMREL